MNRAPPPGGGDVLRDSLCARAPPLGRDARVPGACPSPAHGTFVVALGPGSVRSTPTHATHDACTVSNTIKRCRVHYAQTPMVSCLIPPDGVYRQPREAARDERPTLLNSAVRAPFFSCATTKWKCTACRGCSPSFPHECRWRRHPSDRRRWRRWSTTPRGAPDGRMRWRWHAATCSDADATHDATRRERRRRRRVTSRGRWDGR